MGFGNGDAEEDGSEKAENDEGEEDGGGNGMEEIEAAAEELPPEQKVQLIRFLSTRLRPGAQEQKARWCTREMMPCSRLHLGLRR